MKKKQIKIFLIAIVVIGAVCSCVAGYLYKIYMKTPIAGPETTVCVHITPDMSLDSLQATLAAETGDKTAKRIIGYMQHKGYDATQQASRTGYYEISGSASIRQAAGKLMYGSETPIRFTFNNLRLQEQLVELADSVFYMSGDSLTALLSDKQVCANYGFNPTTIATMFLPDTYEYYWSVSPTYFLDRMHNYYRSFWNEERVEKAKRTGLTPIEVSILASIVEEETAKVDEMPVVAGLYINRLRRNIPLQADPTVKFAVGDFTLKRILNAHLNTPSPYNTYLNLGLPPGPIRIPSKAAINAVLNYTEHNYLYMCAKEDFSGYHNFARTLSEHNNNAQRYHRALNSRGIK